MSTPLCSASLRAATSARALKPMIDRLRRQREVDVGLGDAAHRRVHDVDLDLVGRQLGQRLRQRLVAALHVGLDDERQRLDSRPRPSGRTCSRASPPAAWRASRRGTCPGGTARSRAPCARRPAPCTSSPASGTSDRPWISTGIAGPASCTALPVSSVIARTRPNTAPASTMSPRFSVPDCTSTVATGPLPLSRRDFDDDALAPAHPSAPSVPAPRPAAGSRRAARRCPRRSSPTPG